MGIKDFIIKYESNFHKLGMFNIKLPEGVQSFFVLKAANITEENERLARVTCPELKYANMKETLLKIFSDPSSSIGDENVPAVKIEPVYKVTHRGSYRGDGRGNYGRQFGVQSN